MFPFNDILLLFHGYDIISLPFSLMRQFWGFSLLHTCLFFCLLIWVPSSVVEAFCIGLVGPWCSAQDQETTRLKNWITHWDCGKDFSTLSFTELETGWTIYRGNFWGQCLQISFLDRSDSVGKNFSLSFLEDQYLAAGLLGVVLGKMARDVCIQQFTWTCGSWHPSFFSRLE